MSDTTPNRWSFTSNYDERGVDLTLIAHMLSLSPLEKLQLMERHAREIKWLNENALRVSDPGTPASR
ncbi:MAG: hypothetical protein WD468_05795 [Pirellulales bacterium]